jgi:aryl carrier-like protein
LVAHLFQTTLETISEALGQPIVDSMTQSDDAILSSEDTSGSNQLNGQATGLLDAQNLSLPSARTRTIVSQAWDRIGLAVHGRDDENDDCSMFSWGADLVTAMLLSRCYHGRGHDLSMQDIMNNPTQGSQSRLLEMKVQNSEVDP